MNRFEDVWEIYTEAFPVDERRSRISQCRIMNNTRYQIIPYLREGQLIGFMGLWKLPSFVFLEHFAIKKAFRGLGYGTEMLKELLILHGERVILEVEPPENHVAQSRISFYERHGFSLNTYKYIQPPYEDGQRALPLFLMSYPKSLAKEAFDGIVGELYQFVYEVSADKV
ncbi:MAG: hypothetical protein K0R93_908 [Anaerosolibacter sp.]|uniref:GNAT family N-acetyltransferase n=1 Tax=Anaerosolibacter sp. TaxID=1872527 RepID=UPI00260F470A|nr:GNAT family N-acetyltransferase [Anaerosolibacter sp.]MDF2546010.1 hypothetical protein [Anaerosolibacter sp.]